MKIDVAERALKTALGVSGNLLGVVLDKANLSCGGTAPTATILFQ
jgi:hypothetical protein